MNLLVDCLKCRNSFEVPSQLAGGITNCPYCHTATDVPGLRDPIWMGLRTLAVVGSIATMVAVDSALGPLLGIFAGISMLGLLWLISRAL